MLVVGFTQDDPEYVGQDLVVREAEDELIFPGQGVKLQTFGQKLEAKILDFK